MNDEWAKQWPIEEIWIARKRALTVRPRRRSLLASTSPQRRAILEQLGIPFDVVAPATRSTTRRTPTRTSSSQHARGKARSVAREAGDRPVLGVDTTVALDGGVFGKPEGAGDAERMLERARGPDAPRRVRPLPAHARVGARGAGGDA